MLDNIALFIHVAEAGSLKVAAERLNIPLATVSRHMSLLEKNLNCLLFKRSTKGLVLTKEGEIYYESCAWHTHELHRVIADAHKSYNSLEGELHILAPTNFALTPLNAFWALFTEQYPEISLHIELDNQIVDFQQLQADLAIRVGYLDDSSLIQTALGYVDVVLVGAPPALFKGQYPKTVADLGTNNTIMSWMDWELTHLQTGERYSVQKTHTHTTTDITLGALLAKSGAGIALLPLSEVHSLIQTGDLVHILPDWVGQRRPISIVRPSRNYYSARVKAFYKALTAFIREQPWINIP